MVEIGVKSVFEVNGVMKYTELDEVRNFLDALPNINSGGCGIAAYTMYLWLKEQNMLTEDFQLAFLHCGYSKKDYLHNKQILEEAYEGLPVAPEHVGIYYKGKLIDSSGAINTREYEMFLNIPLEKAEDYLVNSLNTNNWNSWFNRPEIVKVIERELGLSFRVDMRRENKG